ncbi:MAG: hypothetical protein J0J10_26270 [Bosea sp.]|uniref:head-tail connector protein n=1 Tax=Bosea sp. (in: a-proteobacteria) TaxID=1871050 RepID=UPI001ACAA584|nr:hypothetical protein [Bosea sp. (in: a-proteobacteria)]MBN9472272.1 hypothetical protein [Bosea sp. (in: a-proteobacteria)]
MRVVVITEPPVILPIVDAKEHLAIDAADTHDDGKIAAYVAAATAHIDGPAGWLGRSLGKQTLELRRCGFPTWIDLQYGPVLSVVSVKYDDQDGNEQTLDPSLYVVHGSIVARAPGASWPAVRQGGESVRVRYEAGYDDGKVPTPIIQAIKLIAGDFYRFTESATMGAVNSVPMSDTAERLLAPYKVWHL